jgi:hypothetical protein
MSFVITAVPPLVTLSRFIGGLHLLSFFHRASHEMALEPIARALQIILQPPTARQLANFVFLL